MKQLGKSWLGGLDSNQDNQIQSLMYCQLYDLPVVAKKIITIFGILSAIKPRAFVRV